MRNERVQRDKELDDPVATALGAIVRVDWYLRTNHVALHTVSDGALHFVEHGHLEMLDPTPLFDSWWYREAHDLPMVAAPVEHYLAVGAAVGLDPSPVFDSNWYLRQSGEMPPGVTPLEHFLTVGWKLGLDPHPLFSTAWYVQQLDSSSIGGLSPFEHFLAEGWRDGLNPCALFSVNGYLTRYADVAAAGVNPFVHYAKYGWREGRSASDLMDDAEYRSAHADDASVDSLGTLAHFRHVASRIGEPISVDPLAASIARALVRAESNAERWLVVDPEGIESPRIDWDARAAATVVRSSDSPRVSVVIPTLGHSADVIRCLESISDSGDSTPFEVVVVDDGSSPEHSARLDLLGGIRVERHTVNQGFSAACETGVEVSSAPRILLLNNDTEVVDGWLDASVARMEADPDIGIVGSMLVRGDLRLQEAGCIMFVDGRATQFGYGDAPLRWMYRTTREVDYCSGALLLIDRELWDEVGGFDERFAPAYYEDTDLCFSCRAAGRTVVYEPRSVVIHREGTSHGRDGLGSKKYEYRNRKLFVKKWSAQLANQPNPISDDQPLSALELLRNRDRRCTRHVLVFDHAVPTPDKDSGSVRMSHLLESLVDEGLIVHLITMDEWRRQPYTDRLEAIGVEVVGASRVSIEIEEFVASLEGRIEFVLMSRPHVAARFMSTFLWQLAGVPIVYDMVDAHGERLHRTADLTGDPRLRSDAAKITAIEAAVGRLADVVITVSQQDEEFIERVAGIPIRTVRVPNIHHVEDIGGGFGTRSTLLFVGGFNHPPNIDAAMYLAHEVMPLIRSRVAGARLVLAGSSPPAEVRALAAPDIDVPGWIADLGPVYDGARVVVAPLRVGAGVKGKIGEALARGVPVVSTDVGAEGMGLVDRTDVLLASGPEEFADRVAELYTDESLWHSIREAGIRSVDASFGRAATAGRVRDLLAAIAEVRTRRD